MGLHDIKVRDSSRCCYLPWFINNKASLYSNIITLHKNPTFPNTSYSYVDSDPRYQNYRVRNAIVGGSGGRTAPGDPPVLRVIGVTTSSPKWKNRKITIYRASFLQLFFLQCKDNFDILNSKGNRKICLFLGFCAPFGQDCFKLKVFFEEKILLVSFPDTYLGPNLGPTAPRIDKRCDF